MAAKTPLRYGTFRKPAALPTQGDSRATLRSASLGFVAAIALCLAGTAPARGALITHYDASALGLANGSLVNTITDISGNGNDAAKSASAISVGTYVTNGIGGRGSIQFTRDPAGGFNSNGVGYQSALNLGTAFGIQGDAGFTQIIVFRSSGNPNPADLGTFSWVSSLGTGLSLHQGAITEIQGDRLDIATAFSNDVTLGPGSFTPLANQDVILTVVHRGGTGGPIGSTFEVYVNGVMRPLSTTGDAATAVLDLANNRFFLGGAQNGTGGGFNGLISEAMVYNTDLNQAERSAIEVQLGQKYGISVASGPTNAVPEPTGVALLGTGLFGLLVHRRRKMATS